MLHPAVQHYRTLYRDLENEVKAGYVKVSSQGMLRLYTYTQQATYENHWNPITRSARGLILDSITLKIVALPFPKFFNLQQYNDPLPDLSFRVFEKMDGSLIVCWHHNGSWHTSTKGSFSSPQAILAQEMLNSLNTEWLDPYCTYLFELIGPRNKIVVPYQVDKLVMLGGYDLVGRELSWQEIKETSKKIGVRTPFTYQFASLSDIVSKAETLNRNREGYVVRYSDGTRFKIKGSEYLSIHRLISNLTPLNMWRMLKDTPAQLDNMRREIDEELWEDFDNIKYLLAYRLDSIYAELEVLSEQYSNLSDKELGLIINTIPNHLRKFIFPFRKDNKNLNGRFRESVFQHIRPTGNALEGYRASSSMNRIAGEVL